VGAILIGLFFYIPVVLSDVYTKGDNLNQFIYAVTAKTDGSDMGTGEKLRQISIAFSLFLTSFGHKDSFVSAWAGILLISLGLGSWGYLWRKCKEKRAFLYLILIWFLVFIALQIKTDSSLKPRFFMPIAAIPFIFLGFIYASLDKLKSLIVTGIIVISFFVFLLLNYTGINAAYGYYSNHNKSEISRKLFLKQDDGKVLEQHRLATKYMSEAVRKTGKIACFSTSATYERTYEFLFKVYYPDVEYDRISKAIEDKDACQYFSIVTIDNEKLISNNYDGYFNFEGSVKFGRVQVWNLTAKENFLNYDEDEDLTRKENQKVKEKTSEEISAELEESLMEIIEETGGYEEEEAKAPDRVERVLWKQVL
jgi:hypothetical protein